MKLKIITAKEIESLKIQSTEGINNSINSFVLKYEDLINLESLFLEKSIAILGGDVLVLKNQEFEHTYDNWFTEIEENEPSLSYVKRSVDDTRKYIQLFKSDDVYFQLVTKIIK